MVTALSLTHSLPLLLFPSFSFLFSQTHKPLQCQIYQNTSQRHLYNEPAPSQPPPHNLFLEQTCLTITQNTFWTPYTAQRTTFIWRNKNKEKKTITLAQPQNQTSPMWSFQNKTSSGTPTSSLLFSPEKTLTTSQSLSQTTLLWLLLAEKPWNGFSNWIFTIPFLPSQHFSQLTTSTGSSAPSDSRTTNHGSRNSLQWRASLLQLKLKRPTCPFSWTSKYVSRSSLCMNCFVSVSDQCRIFNTGFWSMVLTLLLWFFFSWSWRWGRVSTFLKRKRLREWKSWFFPHLGGRWTQ